MPNPKGNVLLVGSVPLKTVDEVFRTCGTLLGNDVASLPDGEVGDRSYWILYVAYNTFFPHPSVVTLQKPKEGWKPASMDDIFSFKLKDGLKSIHFDKLGYAEEAAKSYRAFRKARDDGAIAKGVRFQVAFPFPQDATFIFFHEAADRAIVEPAYEEVLAREIDTIFREIPAEDLAIQFDVCTDLLEAEGTFYSWSKPETAWERYAGPLHRLPRHVPEKAALGYHFCYGTFPKKPVIEPKDLGLSVKFANAAIAESGRRVDYIQLTVPIQRDDEAYFKPLQNLKAGDTRVFLGVVNSDGLEGAKRRAQAARKYLKDFGISAECGFGRELPERIPELLKIHREVADGLMK